MLTELVGEPELFKGFPVSGALALVSGEVDLAGGDFHRAAVFEVVEGLLVHLLELPVLLAEGLVNLRMRSQGVGIEGGVCGLNLLLEGSVERFHEFLHDLFLLVLPGCVVELLAGCVVLVAVVPRINLAFVPFALGVELRIRPRAGITLVLRLRARVIFHQLVERGIQAYVR